MSIYEKDSYSQSKCVFLGGPIEYWWDSPDEPDRWRQPLAMAYRAWRDMVNDAFVEAGYLVYRPWGAFKGSWNEKFQGVNDFVLERSDVFVNLTPRNYGVVALGTDHEAREAIRFGVPLFRAPFPHKLGTDPEDPFHIELAQALAKFFVSEVDKDLAELLH